MTVISRGLKCLLLCVTAMSTLMSFTAVIEYVVQWIIVTVGFLVSVEGFRTVILLFSRNCPLGRRRRRSSVRT